MSACGGNRLSHDAIVTAVNGGPLTTGQVLQQQQPGAVPAVPQNSAISSTPGGTAAIDGVSPGGARSATVTGGATASAAGAGTLPAGDTTRSHEAAGSAPAAARPTGPLAPILIGNVGNYSGPAGSSTSAAPAALQVWAQWTNAHGGIAGHPVHVHSADDGADPARSRSVIQDMVENKHVIAFVGNMAILDADAGVQYLEQKHIPVVGGDVISAPWTSSPVLFPMGTTVLPLIEAALKAAHDAGQTKLGLVYCVEVPACDVINKHVTETASRYGEQIVDTSRVTVTQPDYTATCLGLQQSGAQAVWLAVEANSQERFGNSCQRQNYHPLYLTINQTSTTQEAHNPTLDGMVAPAPAFPWMVGGNAEIDAYHQAIQQYASGIEESGSTAIQWASGELFRKATAAIGAAPTSDAIFNGLWALRNETLGGLTPPLTFAAHQPSPQITCYYLTKIAGGRWTAPYGARLQCL